MIAERSTFQRRIDFVQVFAAMQGADDPALAGIIDVVKQRGRIILQPLVERLGGLDGEACGGARIDVARRLRRV